MSTQFLESEVARLAALLNARCVKYYDEKEIAFTMEEWKQTLIEDVKEFYTVEGSTMNKLTGLKVRTINSSQGSGCTLIDHGVISYNFLLYIEKAQPFEGLDHRDAPAIDRDQFADGPEGSAEYFKAQQAQAQAQVERLERLRYQASLLYIRWFDANGNEMCAGWHDAATVVLV